jgi:[ribosomal protein S5]-alanine N-acetyltransferase
VTIRTARLRLRELAAGDAPFVLALLNEPSFIQYIGDRAVRTLEEARTYIASGPVASYAQHGFGLYLVELAADGAPIGICGILRREALPDPDLGFAFVPAYWKQGYAFEAAGAIQAHAHVTLGIRRLLAVTNPSNEPSIRLLEKLGFRFEGMTQLTDGGAELKLFADEDEHHG